MSISKSYVKTAWRNITRHAGFSAINIISLSVGLAATLLIVLLIWTQTKVDVFHPDRSSIYRVTFSSPPSFRVQTDRPFATTPHPLATVLRENVSGVKAVARIRPTANHILKGGEPVSHRSFFAEQPFFDVLSGFKLAQGDSESALQAPQTVVLSANMASRLFGDKSAIGQTVAMADKGDFEVTGVLAPRPSPSHLPFDALFSYRSLTDSEAEDLGSWNEASDDATYVRLHSGKSADALTSSMNQATADFYPAAGASAQTFGLQSLSDIPFSTPLYNEIGGRLLPPSALYPLVVLAFLVAFAAGFNYASLSVARSIQRGQEMGVRRAIGAGRGQIASQFIGEALLVSTISFGGALLVLLVTIPAFSSLAIVQSLGMTLSLHSLLDPTALALCFGTCLLVGLLSGLYPAWALSRHRPADVLRASGSSGGSSTSRLPLQKPLTFIQFSFSTIVLVTGVVLYMQANHMNEADYGLQTEDTIALRLQGASFETIKNEVQALSDVEHVTGTSLIPASGTRLKVAVSIPDTNDVVSLQSFTVTPSFLTSMGLKYYDDASPDVGAFQNEGAIYVNRKAVRDLRFDHPNAAIGQQVNIPRLGTRTIAGVIEDFRPNHLMMPLQPMMLHAGPASKYEYALIGTTSGQTASVLGQLRETWPKINPEKPLVAQSYREILSGQTSEFVEFAHILSLASLLSILIACLGLLGLTAYQVQIRSREIAIRRAMGANVLNVLALLSRGLLALVTAAVALALPAAWYINTTWLQNLPYRIDLGVDTLLVCGICILIFAVVAAGSQAVPVARTAPATALGDA